MKKKVLTPIAEISFDKAEKILHVKVLENSAMTLENAQEHYRLINKLVSSEKYVALVDSSQFYTIEKEAWQYASQPHVISNRIAAAHYNSLISNKLTTNFFTSTYSAALPLRVFSKKEEAIAWLKTFITQ